MMNDCVPSGFRRQRHDTFKAARWVRLAAGFLMAREGRNGIVKSNGRFSSSSPSSCVVSKVFSCCSSRALAARSPKVQLFSLFTLNLSQHSTFSVLFYVPAKQKSLVQIHYESSHGWLKLCKEYCCSNSLWQSTRGRANNGINYSQTFQTSRIVHHLLKKQKPGR